MVKAREKEIKNQSKCQANLKTEQERFMGN